MRSIQAAGRRTCIRSPCVCPCATSFCCWTSSGKEGGTRQSSTTLCWELLLSSAMLCTVNSEKMSLCRRATPTATLAKQLRTNLHTTYRTAAAKKTPPSLRLVSLLAQGRTAPGRRSCIDSQTRDPIPAAQQYTKRQQYMTGQCNKEVDYSEKHSSHESKQNSARGKDVVMSKFNLVVPSGSVIVVYKKFLTSGMFIKSIFSSISLTTLAICCISSRSRSTSCRTAIDKLVEAPPCEESQSSEEEPSKLRQQKGFFSKTPGMRMRGRVGGTAGSLAHV